MLIVNINMLIATLRATTKKGLGKQYSKIKKKGMKMV